uniref:Uncharacterized protein n=1 Tax=Arundo donax TaxID=35708 RepID=A0A0A9D3Q2_ARUDO
MPEAGWVQIDGPHSLSSSAIWEQISFLLLLLLLYTSKRRPLVNSLYLNVISQIGRSVTVQKCKETSDQIIYQKKYAKIAM